MYAQRFAGVLGVFILLTLAGCGGRTAGSGANVEEGAATALAITADPTGQLKFQPETLDAPAGQPITVSFKNPAPLQHNWVLVPAGQEQAVADAAGRKGGDATGVEGVIATTAVLNANGEERTEVTDQPAGTYSYICTVPGHYAAGMKGTLTIK